MRFSFVTVRFYRYLLVSCIYCRGTMSFTRAIPGRGAACNAAVRFASRWREIIPRALALALACLPMALVAQATSRTAPPAGDGSRFVVAGAGGRFELATAPPRDRIDGLTAEQARELAHAVEQAVGVFRANPAVHAPPAPMCTRIHSHLPPVAVDPGPDHAANVSVQIPIAFRDGRCTKVSCCGVDLELNSLARLLKGRELRGPGGAVLADGAAPMYVLFNLKSQPAAGAYARYERVVVLSKRSGPMFVPASRAAYLQALARAWEARLAELQQQHDRSIADLERQREQLREQAARTTDAKLRQLLDDQVGQIGRNLEQFRSQLAQAGSHERAALAATRDEFERLSPQDRTAPACRPRSGDYLPSWRPDCPETDRVVMLNPAFFDRSLPKSAIQVMVLSNAPRYTTESPESAQLRQRIFETTDLDGLAAILR